jgi:dihydroneopterin aldolase
MKIYIEKLKFKCIIGILDFERIKKQNIVINASIKYKYEDEFINYAQAVKIIKSIMKKNKFYLIEEALEVLQKELKRNFESISSIKIKITKPSILPDCKVSVENHYKFIS